MDASGRSGTVKVGDVDLAYLRIGEGTPLVVLPGGPRMGYAHMHAGFDRLADVCELVYYDERGSGASPLGNRDGVSTEQLRAISCPTLVVHAELDPIPVESSRFIAGAIPDAELVVIPGESHFAFMENPAAFGAAVRPFLERHSS